MHTCSFKEWYEICYSANMIRNFIHLFFTFLALSAVFSQEGKIVQIKGFAPSYVGQTISVMEIEDYFSMNEIRLASTSVSKDSTFTVSFYLKETQKLMLQANKNSCFPLTMLK